MVKRLIPFIFSAVLGLIAVVMLQQYLGKERAKLAKQQQELQALFQDQISVIVAMTEIPAGTAIAPEHLDSKLIPSKFVQPYATTRGVDVLGLVPIAPISQGEQILTNKLRREREQPMSATLAGLTPEGKRAVTVGLDSLTGVGGFVRPGNSVDILWTFKVPSGGGSQEGELVTMPLFQNVAVLAVGAEMVGKSTTDREASSEYTVTLALEPQEALLLLFAREQGGIQVSLRPPSDTEQLAVGPANMSTLMESVLGKDATGEAPKPQRTVEVIRGLEHSVVAVNE